MSSKHSQPSANAAINCVEIGLDAVELEETNTYGHCERAEEMVENFDIEKDKEFYVRDIPNHVTEWDLFHRFSEYGMVANVKIPTNQNNPRKYGFVTMMTFDGADKLRSVRMSNRIVLDENFSLVVTDCRAKDQVPEKRTGFGAKKPEGRGPSNQNKSNKTVEKAKDYVPTSVKITHRDFPLNKTVSAQVVLSPYPCNESQFLFHAKSAVDCLPKEYDELQGLLNQYCASHPVSHRDVPEGGFGLVVPKAIAYRAERVSKESWYLLDVGKMVDFIPGAFWEIPSEFMTLPLLVVPCTVADVQWTKPSVATFTSIRKVILDWCTSLKSINLTTVSYKGKVNIVKLESTGSDLSASLVKKNVCSEAPVDRLQYSHEEIMALKHASASKTFEHLSLATSFADLGISTSVDVV